MKKSAAVFHIVSVRPNGSEALIAVRRAGSSAAALRDWQNESGHTAVKGSKTIARLA